MIFKHRAHYLDKVMEIKQVETDITIVILTMCFASIMLPRKLRRRNSEAFVKNQDKSHSVIVLPGEHCLFSIVIVGFCHFLSYINLENIWM